jgi:hypothetical protein
MGKPDTTIRQCPFAMDKWEELIIVLVQTMLGVIINTYKLTVGIPDNWYGSSQCGANSNTY